MISANLEMVIMVMGTKITVKMPHRISDRYSVAEFTAFSAKLLGPATLDFDMTRAGPTPSSYS